MPTWMTDTRCLRVICVGLLGVCSPWPLAVLAALFITGDVVYGRSGVQVRVRREEP